MNSTLEEIRAQGILRVLAWEDPLVDALGHDPRSYYVERFWLPVLGPSSTFLLRHIGQCLERSPSGFEVELAEAARRLGLGEHSGRNAPINRTLARCVDFEMAKPAGFATLAVRRRLPPLTRRHLGRLTPALLDEHARWEVASRRPPAETATPAGAEGGERRPGATAARRVAASTEAPGSPASASVALLRQRGRQLALSLLDLGEDVPAAERQLLRWRFHPAMARECAEWADAQRCLRPPAAG